MYGEQELPRSPRVPPALYVWAVCAGVLIGPSLLVWLVRLLALATHCGPGPDPCGGMILGIPMRDTLGLASAFGSDQALGLAIAFAAAIAALWLRRPLLACLSVLILPICAVELPALAVDLSTYGACQVSEDGPLPCALWGADVGPIFHRTALAAATFYDTVPYATALALMVAVIGYAFLRPRPAGRHSPQA
jgi:hypothetical protein